MTLTKNCDFCTCTLDAESEELSKYWGTLDLGLGIIGQKRLKDICAHCSKWLYDMAEQRRKDLEKTE